MNIRNISAATLALLLCLNMQAQQRSEKRGLGWDEKTLAIGSQAISQLAPGVSWLYNWGETPRNEPTQLADGGAMLFLPMAWNGNFNENALRRYLASHPKVTKVLGFNEPNFSAQANMTPTSAATAWKKLEAIAADYNVELVAPALNFTGERVGGRTWSPFEWYDAFFEAYPEAKVDYLAFHCYMNWAGNIDWIADRYFYTEGNQNEQNLFYADNVAKYPHFVAYMNSYKELHGHYPKLFLTEFCSWESDVYPYASGLTTDFQIDQMTQKLQYLEKSDNVAGYAWFMANTSGGAATFPYMSVLQTNSANSELSTLGKVYTHMSAFDKEKYYAPGETILAKDYIDATLDNYQVKLRPSTDAASASPLQVELPSSGSATWQISTPTADTYPLRMRVKTTAEETILVYLDGKRTATATLPATDGKWGVAEVKVKLPAGRHTLMVFNFGSEPVVISQLTLLQTTGIQTLHSDDATPQRYRPDGTRAEATARGLIIELTSQNGERKAVKRFN